jgi:hypothetical protein
LWDLIGFLYFCFCFLWCRLYPKNVELDSSKQAVVLVLVVLIEKAGCPLADGLSFSIGDFYRSDTRRPNTKKIQISLFGDSDRDERIQKKFLPPGADANVAPNFLRFWGGVSTI